LPVWRHVADLGSARLDRTAGQRPQSSQCLGHLILTIAVDAADAKDFSCTDGKRRSAHGFLLPIAEYPQFAYFQNDLA
jgi:hypothetical protein